MLTNVTPLHHQALAKVGTLITGLSDLELSLPTPCQGWSLRGLLEHMVGQNHGFAAAARGDGADPAQWLPRALGPDPARTWQLSADQVEGAFALADVSTQVELAEFASPQPFPLQAAQSFHFLDTVIHGWDVAAAIGVPYECDRETTELLVGFATEIPASAEDRGPLRPFRAVVQVPADAGPLDHALALTGRDPAWTAPSSRGPA